MFILAVMFLGLLLSMWINNHTAPILCTTVILPIVRDLPTDSRFSKTLLLGLAFACNFGGLAAWL
jgi:phosphate transporter